MPTKEKAVILVFSAASKKRDTFQIGIAFYGASVKSDLADLAVIENYEHVTLKSHGL